MRRTGRVLITLLGGLLGCAGGSHPADLPPGPDLGQPDLAGARRVRLTVRKTGGGGGAVVSDPPGIDCGPTCAADFDEGAAVRLRVTPERRSAFAGWSGPCAGQGGVCALDAAALTIDAELRPKVCSAAGWCQELSGTSRALYAVSGTGAADVWIAGEAGTLLRFDGAAYLPVPSGVSATLRGVWAGAGAAFAVGDDGVALRWDGARWSAEPSGTTRGLRAVSGAAGGGTFAVGLMGTALRHDGARFSPTASGVAVDLNGVWSSAADRAFAVATDTSRGAGMPAGAAVLGYDGGAWRTVVNVPLQASLALRAIHGRGADLAWAVGQITSSGTYPTGCAWYRYDGMSWTLGYASVGCPDLTGVWVGGAADVWMTGPAGLLRHWNGTGFDGAHPYYKIDSGTMADLNAVWGTGGGDVLAVGAAGTILRYEP